MLTIVIAAVICTAAILVGIHVLGIRYMKVNITDNSYVKFFGTVHPNVYAIHMLWGDCCAQLQEYGEAATAYTQALETAKLVFTQGADQITQAEQKLQELAP